MGNRNGTSKKSGDLLLGSGIRDVGGTPSHASVRSGAAAVSSRRSTSSGGGTNRNSGAVSRSSVSTSRNSVSSGRNSVSTGRNSVSTSRNSGGTSRGSSGTGRSKKDRTSGTSEGHSRNARDTGLSREISGICLIIIGILLGIFCYFGSSGLLAAFVPFLFGLFGICMYIVPVIVIASGVLLIAYPRGKIKRGAMICTSVILACAMTIIHIAANIKSFDLHFGEFIKLAYSSGGQFRGGGLFGGVLSYILVALLGTTGSFVVLCGIALIMLMLITHISLRSAGISAKSSLARASEERRERKRAELYNEELEYDTAAESVHSRGKNRHRSRDAEDEHYEPEFDEETGFLRHSGRPLTAGDCGYERGTNTNKHEQSSASERNTEGYDASERISDSPAASKRESGRYGSLGALFSGRKRGRSGKGGAPEDDLEFFPVSGVIKTDKPVRRRGEELKPSFNTESARFDRFGRRRFGLQDYEEETFDIPMDLTYADIERGRVEASAAIPNASAADDSEVSDEAPEQADKLDNSAAKADEGADDDILAGVTITRMDDAQQDTENHRIDADTAENRRDAANAENTIGTLGKTDTAGLTGAANVSNSSDVGTSNAAGAGQNTIAPVAMAQVTEYQRPPYSLLKLPDPISAVASESPAEKARILIETLNSFSISARIINISVGPVITRFELQPAQGIRVNRITTLSNDIALALAAPRVRIEAPIPGKAAIGIEIPNKDTAPVLLREVLETKEFSAARSPLTLALGKDIAGKIVLADLGKMPHLLIAGQTGSGKSVCINTIILSLVYKSSPQDVRMILIDPKVVELNIFAALPHLFCPVVTEPKKAAGALRWAVMEMDQRYLKMGKVNARDINRYNSLQENEEDKWPRLVIIIDELSDLMLVASKDVEESICRIAQLGRACGIHLIVATQRPSVDVITGLIKANIPSRIAFAVANGTDSRVILDVSGAEKLLGHGDMLFYANGASKPLRAQGAFATDEEVEAVTQFFTENSFTAPNACENSLTEIVTSGAPYGQGNGKQEDDLLPDAVRIVIESGAASISMLQRRLRVGYARAARLVDIMEQNKYVSASDGSKPRKVLITAAEYNRVFGGNIKLDMGGEANDEMQ